MHRYQHAANALTVQLKHTHTNTYVYMIQLPLSLLPLWHSLSVERVQISAVSEVALKLLRILSYPLF